MTDKRTLYNFVRLIEGQQYNHPTATVTIKEEPTVGKPLSVYSAVNGKRVRTTSIINTIDKNLLIDDKGQNYILFKLKK